MIGKVMLEKEGVGMRVKQTPFQNVEDLNGLNQIQPFQRSFKNLAEIAHSKVDFQLSQKIKMNNKVNRICDLNWDLKPVQFQINLPVKRLWISSYLTGEITYTKGSDTQLHIQSFQLPCKATHTFDYIAQPIPPRSDEKKEYDFVNYPGDTEYCTHYEQIIFNNEAPLLDIIATKVVTAQTIKKGQRYSSLILELDCEIEYRIFQYQVIKSDL